MQAKICVISGATSGIGMITARELARQGARVLLIARNETKAQATVADIQRLTNNQNVDYVLADLAIQADIQRAADEIERRIDKIDVLVNNAGAFFNSREETADGYERTWAVNHLNYFLLTSLLFDLVRTAGTPAAPARIVNVASEAHRGGKIQFEDLQGQQGYNGWRAYAQSKLANIMFSYQLARRIGYDQPPVTVNALHPGFVATNFGSGTGLMNKVVKALMNVIAISPDQGAQTSIYLAASSEVVGVTSNYFDTCRAVSSSQRSYNLDDQQRLWEVSEAQTGRAFEPEKWVSSR